MVGDLFNVVELFCTFLPSGQTAEVHGTLEGTFIGAVDPGGIATVDCKENFTGSVELFAALQFGTIEDDVPSSSPWGGIALIGALLCAAGVLLRRRADA